MALTVSAVNACDASLWLDDATGIQQDISGSSNVVDLNFDQNIADYTAFQNEWPGRMCCGKDASFTVTVIYSRTNNEAYDVIKNWYFGTASCTARSFSLYLPDKDVGSDFYTAEVLLENFTFTADRGEAGPIMVTATLLPHGTVTLSTAVT